MAIQSQLKDTDPSFIYLITDPYNSSLPLQCWFEPPPVNPIPLVFQQEFSSTSLLPPFISSSGDNFT